MKLKNILIITQWSFKDALVQAYTLPYVYIIARKIPPGSKIYLVTFEQKQFALTPEETEDTKNQLRAKGIELIKFNYSRFGILAIIKSVLAVLKMFVLVISRKVHYIHAWGTPAGSLAFILSVLTGRTLIIDSYEPHAEAMVENKTWVAGGFRYKLLFYLEKKLSEHATFVVSATEGMREYAARKYGVAIRNFFVKPACVDLDIFHPSRKKNKILLRELKLEDKIICVYAGKFGGIYLTEEVFRFFHFAERKWGDKFRALLLTSYDKSELISWAEKTGFSTDKMIIKFVEHKDIPDYMGMGDFAITPVKPIPTKRYCTPIKDGEYWALGLPVVISKDISDDSEIIRNNNAGVVIDELNDTGYKNAIERVSEIIAMDRTADIRAIAKKYRSFEIAERIYEVIYGDDKNMRDSNIILPLPIFSGPLLLILCK